MYMVHLQLLAQICSFSFCDLMDACEILKMEGYVSALDEEPDAEESPPSADAVQVQAEASEDAIVEDGEDLQVQAEASEDAIVEDGEDLQIQAEASEDAIVEDGEDLQILAEACHITLTKQDREIKKLKRQRDQSIKQARQWQAQAQQQRANVCKLEAENTELLQWVLHIENEDEDAKQQPGESFSQWEERQNFPPGVPLPSWPLSDFQGDPPVLAPKQPVGPPPSYLIKRFQSQTSSSSSQKVLSGLNKTMPIGQQIVKRHAKETWKRAPVP